MSAVPESEQVCARLSLETPEAPLSFLGTTWWGTTCQELPL